MSHPYGFLDFEEDDSGSHGGLNSVILSSQCTSLAEVQAAGGVAVGTGQTFDSSRGLIGNAGGGIKWETGSTSNTNFAARAAELKNAGHLTLWVEASVLDPLISSPTSETLFTFGTGTFPTMIRTNTLGLAALWPRMAGLNTNPVLSTAHNRSGFVRLDISWTSTPGAANYSCTADFYVEKCLIHTSTLATAPNWVSTRFSFWCNGGGTFGPTTTTGALYRLQLSTRPIMLASPREHLFIACFGDSITTQGGRYAYTPFHPNTAGSNGTRGEAGYVMGIRRLYAERNMLGYELNYAVSGTTSSAFTTHITNCFTTAGHRPKIATVMYGTNDAITSVAAATYDTNIRAGLDELFDTWGVSKVFIIKPPSIYNDSDAVPPKNTQTYIDFTDNYGAKIDAMAADYPNLVIVDGLTATGGHTGSASYFDALDVHLNQKGQKALSDALNAKLMTEINWNT